MRPGDLPIQWSTGNLLFTGGAFECHLRGLVHLKQSPNTVLTKMTPNTSITQSTPTAITYTSSGDIVILLLPVLPGPDVHKWDAMVRISCEIKPQPLR